MSALTSKIQLEWKALGTQYKVRSCPSFRFRVIGCKLYKKWIRRWIAVDFKLLKSISTNWDQHSPNDRSKVMLTLTLIFCSTHGYAGPYVLTGSTKFARHQAVWSIFHARLSSNRDLYWKTCPRIVWASRSSCRVAADFYLHCIIDLMRSSSRASWDLFGCCRPKLIHGILWNFIRKPELHNHPLLPDPKLRVVVIVFYGVYIDLMMR